MNTILSLALALTFGSPSAPPQSGKPNIVVVVADDLGYGDASFSAAGGISTPNLEELRSRSVLFTDGYSCGTVCAPSRAGLMTGRYPQRFGFERNDRDQTKEGLDAYGLPVTQQTIAERIKAAVPGYRTGIVGKWHLGYRRELWPTNRGFDYFYGLLEGGTPYWPTIDRFATIYENTVPQQTSGYLTYNFTNKAASFVRDSLDLKQPFFLYLAYTAPHSPYQAPLSECEKFPELEGDRKSYAAMINTMDEGVGKLVTVLRNRGELDNTLFIFVGDNGAPLDGPGSNAPLRGGKAQMFEGGIRVPFMMSWPEKLPQGTTYSNMVSILDIAPTVAAAAGIYGLSEEMDGRNLVPMLRVVDPQPYIPHQELCWRMGTQNAIRWQNWKLIRYDGTSTKPGYEGLFDLSTDIQESANMHLLRPNIAQKLRDKLALWESQMIEPAW
ncbi:MAG TPA: sulfatase-like hydrolase/transferase [Fimbriimonas sp.]|nr:sulfatase-like hydrolase/transferase [Fimbriimonas sp.]